MVKFSILSYLNTFHKLLEKRKHSLHKIMHNFCSEECLIMELRPDVCNTMKISASNVLQVFSFFRIEYLKSTVTLLSYHIQVSPVVSVYSQGDVVRALGIILQFNDKPSQLGFFQSQIIIKEICIEMGAFTLVCNYFSFV